MNKLWRRFLRLSKINNLTCFSHVKEMPFTTKTRPFRPRKKRDTLPPTEGGACSFT